MAADKFVIYTLNGREILNHGQVKFAGFRYELPLCMDYSIDLSNPMEKMFLLKSDEEQERDDTALFYQMREELKEQNGSSKLSEEKTCLTDKIFFVDFENLFMEVNNEFLDLSEDNISKMKDLCNKVNQLWMDQGAPWEDQSMEDIPWDINLNHLDSLEEVSDNEFSAAVLELYNQYHDAKMEWHVIRKNNIEHKTVNKNKEELVKKIHELRKELEECLKKEGKNYPEDMERLDKQAFLKDPHVKELYTEYEHFKKIVSKEMYCQGSEYPLIDMFINGIKVKFNADEEERVFIPFDKSQSMARRSMISFVDEEFALHVNNRLMLGTEHISALIESKLRAYKGLYLSSGQRIESFPGSDLEKGKLVLNERTVIVLPDGPKGLKSDKEICYITNTNDSRKIQTIEGKDILPIKTLFDGEGLISMEYAKLVNKELLGENSPAATSFQIRMPFIKGMVHSIDIKKFLDEYFEGEEKVFVRDCFGYERDLREAEIIITKSMYKAVQEEGTMEDGYDWFCTPDVDETDDFGVVTYSEDPMKNYFRMFHKLSNALYISGTNLPYKNRNLTTLNYQFLNTLDLQEKDLEQLIDYHMGFVNRPGEYLKRIASNMDSEENVSDEELERNSIEMQQADEGLNRTEELEDEVAENEEGSDESEEDTADVSDSPNSKKGHLPGWQAALLANEDFICDSYVKSKVVSMSNSLKKNVAFGKLLVDGEIRYLSRDLLYFLIHLINLVGSYKDSDGLEKGKEVLERVNLGENSDKQKALKEELLHADFFYMPANNIELQKGYHYPILRSPHLSRNEQCVLRACIAEKQSIRHNYFGHLEGVLMVPYKSFVPDTLGGADFDGDIVKVFDSNILRDAVLRGVYQCSENNVNEYHVDYHYERALPIVMINSFKTEAEYIYDNIYYTEQTTYETIYNTFSNNVGVISNLAVRIGKKQYMEGEKVNHTCAECTILTGLEIDACKTGYHPDLSEVKEEVKSKRHSYLDTFIRKMKRIDLIDWSKGFQEITNDKNEIEGYQYKDSYNEFVVLEDKEDTLSRLAYHFMEIGASGNKGKETGKKRNKCIYFDFETEPNWKAQLDEEKLHKIETLLVVYKHVMGIARKAVGEYNRKKTPKWKRYIFNIWVNQYGFSNSDGINWGNLYNDILKFISEHISQNPEDVLARLEKSDWPYLYRDEDKSRLLGELLNVSEEDLGDEVKKYLFNFNCQGYNLLYLFMKEVARVEKLKHFDTIVQEYSSHFMAEDISRFKPSEKDRVYMDELYQKYYQILLEDVIQQKRISAARISSSILVKYRDEIIPEELFGSEKPDSEDEEETLFRLIYRASKNVKKDFFWMYYDTENIVKRVYKKEG